jgi:hypothetical protein
MTSCGAGSPLPVSSSFLKLSRKLAQLHRLLPALVPEQHDREVVLLLEVEADLRADPLLGTIDDLPEHKFSGLGVEDLDVEAAGGPEPKPQHSPDVAVTFRVLRPPARQSLDRGQGRVDVLGDAVAPILCRMSTISIASFFSRIWIGARTRAGVLGLSPAGRAGSLRRCA